MKRTLTIIATLLLVATREPVFTQNGGTVEITAQSILARVDRIMQYPEGELLGKIKHIFPDGNSVSLDFKGCISRNDYLFILSTASRGESLKLLYNMGGEDIWVYDIHSRQMYHKMDVDKYGQILSTNLSFMDFSNSDYQSNYKAKIIGKSLIKGIECYKLELDPVFENSQYGMITLYATVDKYIPLRIDFHDRDNVVFKFLTISKTMEKGERIIPVRYDILNIKDGTVTIISFTRFDESMTYSGEIYRPEKLGD